MTDLEIFHNAPEGATPDELAAYLDEACGNDAALRVRVEALFAAAELERSHDFLSESPGRHMDAAPVEPRNDHETAGVNRFEKPDGVVVLYFGDYELQGEIARGAMGVVHRAEQTSLKRTVAIKMIRSTLLASKDDVTRFRSEAEAAASLDHPNIVPIYEIGEHDGQHYFSMKLIGGGTLRERFDVLRRDRKAAAKLMATVARAIHSAHQRGIRHRDIKPGNILVDKNGEPHLTDFGLAKQLESTESMTLSGQIMGTPNYMAPEQAEGSGKGLTAAADVYALGAVFYEMLTGQPPHRGESLMDTLRLVVEAEPAAPRSVDLGIDRDLETIALKCLEKDPARRYASAGEMANDLERWLGGEPIHARPVGTAERIVKWMKRKPAPAAAAALAALLLLTLGIGGPIAVAWQAKLQANALKDAVKDGDLHSAAGEWELAVAAYSKEIDAGSSHAILFIQRAKAHRQLGDWVAAAKDWSTALDLELDVDKANALYELACQEKVIAEELIWLRPEDVRRHVAGGQWDLAEIAIAKAYESGNDALPGWFQSRYWKLVGYPYGLDTHYPVELSPDPFEPAVIPSSIDNGQPQQQVWEPVATKGDGVVSFGSTQMACHYVLTRLWSPRKQDVAFQIPYHSGPIPESEYGGDRNQIRLFVNDRLLHETKRGPAILDESVPSDAEIQVLVSLRKGWNTILLKVQNKGAARPVLLTVSNRPLELIAARLRPLVFEIGENLDVEQWEEVLAISKQQRQQRGALAFQPQHTSMRSLGNLWSFWLPLLEFEADSVPEELWRIELMEIQEKILEVRSAWVEAGGFEEEIEQLEETLALVRGRGPEATRHIMNLLHGLAQIYEQAGRFDEAIKRLEAMVALREESNRNLKHPKFSPLGYNGEIRERRFYGMLSAQAQQDLARCYAAAGRSAEATALRTEFPAVDAASILARSCINGQQSEVIERYRKALLLDSQNTEAAQNLTHLLLNVGALQVWFEMFDDYEATRRSMFEWAAEADLDFHFAASRIAKLACLRPIPDLDSVEVTLGLSRKVVEIAKGVEMYECQGQMLLGMAEYRAGNYREAEQALSDLLPDSNLSGNIASFYRSMSLFQQGKRDKAVSLFAAAEEPMIPLPADDKNPLADGANLDYLIAWLAYKESKALLGFSRILHDDPQAAGEIFDRALEFARNAVARYRIQTRATLDPRVAEILTANNEEANE